MLIDHGSEAVQVKVYDGILRFSIGLWYKRLVPGLVLLLLDGGEVLVLAIGSVRSTFSRLVWPKRRYT